MTKSIPPLYALRAFEAAARYCSFTQAANELSLTQSAISRHIRTLEDILGYNLFERNGPKLTLTDQGKTLAQELKLGFAIIERACLLFRDNPNTIRLKVPSTLTARWLLKAVNVFKKEYPTYPVQLSSIWMDIDTVDFYSEPYDCAILLTDGNFGPSYNCFKLFDEWLIPICSPSYHPQEKKLTINDLDQLELLHPSFDRRDWKRWLNRLNLLDKVDIRRGQVFDTLDQGISAALQGIGISTNDLMLVSQELFQQHLYLPFPKAVSTGDGYYMVWPKGNPKEKALCLLKDFLINELPPLYTEGVTFFELS